MKNKGFTLIETLIGITLISIAITAVAGLVLTTLLGNARNLHKLQALALAEEGVEAMRYVRDSNWLQNYSWDEGNWGANFDITLEDPIIFYLKEESCSSTPPCWSFSSNEEEGVTTNENGFEFTRFVTVTSVVNDEGEIMADAAEVTATVVWVDRGVERSLDVSTYLSDWQ